MIKYKRTQEVNGIKEVEEFAELATYLSLLQDQEWPETFLSDLLNESGAT